MTKKVDRKRLKTVPKYARQNWEQLRSEFVKGYVKGIYKNKADFARAKGLDNTATRFKEATSGWIQEAKKRSKEVHAKAEKKFLEKTVEEEATAWADYYSVSARIASTALKRIEEVLKGGEDKTDVFHYFDKQGNRRFDGAAFKALLTTANDLEQLHKASYLGGDHKLSAKDKIKIETAKAVKEVENPQETLHNALDDAIVDLEAEESGG